MCTEPTYSSKFAMPVSREGHDAISRNRRQAEGSKAPADLEAITCKEDWRLGRDGKSLSRTFADKEHAHDEDHDHRNVQPDIHEILIELSFSHVRQVAQFSTGRKDTPGAGDNADGKIRLQIQDFSLQESDDRAEQLEENDDE